MWNHLACKVQTQGNIMGYRKAHAPSISRIGEKSKSFSASAVVVTESKPHRGDLTSTHPAALKRDHHDTENVQQLSTTFVLCV